jgi:hypothetical protein
MPVVSGKNRIRMLAPFAKAVAQQALATSTAPIRCRRCLPECNLFPAKNNASAPAAPHLYFRRAGA